MVLHAVAQEHAQNCRRHQALRNHYPLIQERLYQKVKILTNHPESEIIALDLQEEVLAFQLLQILVIPPFPVQI